MDYAHLILTKFNLNRGWVNTGTPDAAWLTHRFGLFDQFCFPSVAGQNNPNFRWLVFFDENTPAGFLPKIDAYRRWPNFIPIFVGDLTTPQQTERIRGYANAPYLITTRLDNDDALSADYVDEVQKQFAHQPLQFLNFPKGHRLDIKTQRLFRGDVHMNPFISLIERTDDARTVWCVGHREIEQVGPVHDITTPARWLQVIHEYNYWNRVPNWPRVPLATLTDFRLNYAYSTQPEDRLAMAWDNIHAIAGHYFYRLKKWLKQYPGKFQAANKRS